MMDSLTKMPVSRIALISRCLLAASVAAVASCTTTTSETDRRSAEWRAQHTGFRQSESWKGKAFKNEEVVAKLTPHTISISIHLDEQRGLLLHDGRDVAIDFPVSTGRRGFRTKPGSYKVIGKNAKHVSNLYGNYVDEGGKVLGRDVDVTSDPRPEGARFVGSPMPYFMRLTNQGLGLHIGKLPGYAASHGCIRVSASVMPEIFKLSPIGTPVVILENAPAQDDT